MKKLNFTNGMEHPYKFVGAMLAPKGAYYVYEEGFDTWATVYPVMYIQLWQDPDGVVWNVPLWSEEVQESFVSDGCTFQEYIEEVINEDRHIETCLTCERFISICQRSGYTEKHAIILVMENMNEYVISGQMGTTPELLDYFKNGVWGNLRTMKNDGTLERGWEKEYLNEDGTIKKVKHE